MLDWMPFENINVIQKAFGYKNYRYTVGMLTLVVLYVAV